MEQGKGRTESRVNRRMRDWQGKISFEKTLGSVAVSTLLTLPANLWQKHGDKVQKFVILQSVADRKMWTVEVQIYFPNKRPQVVFRGGWRLFVVSNGLVKGDRLKFTLTGRSKFEFLILRSGGDPKVRSVLRPKLMSKESELCQRQPKKTDVARQVIDFTRKNSMKSEREVSGLFSKEAGTTQEDSIAHSTSNIICEATSESPSDMGSHFFEAVEIPSDMDSHFVESSEFPSDMDSHFFEPMLQQNKQEGAMSKRFINTLECHRQSQNALPRFCKRIRLSNATEIPEVVLDSNRNSR